MDNIIDIKIKNIFVSIFPDLKDKEFNLNTPRKDFQNWDSLTQLQLVSEIESTFSIRFDMEDIIDIESPADFKKVIEKKLKKSK